MYIPALPLPSNPRTEILFRGPTVADSLNYGSATIECEEEFTTRYLNDMQTGEKKLDSALWTVQDRRTALYWIWCNSRLKHEHTVSYTCDHCGKVHHHDFDMQQLGDFLSLLTVPPFVEVSVPVKRKSTEWVLKPIDGRGMEELQRMYMRLPDKADPNYKAELQNVRFVEIVLQAHLKNQPADFQEAGNMRYEIIKSMDLYSEYVPLVASVKAMQETLRHGLPIFLKDGQPMLYAPPHRCPTLAKEGTDRQMRIYFPFRTLNYIPVDVAGLLGDADT